MSITQTATGYTFTLGQQTYTGYPTREAAATALYDAERGQAPISPEQTIIDTIDRVSQQQPGDLIAAVTEFVVGDGQHLEAERGDVALDLTMTGGSLTIFDAVYNLDGARIAELLDLRTILNAPQVFAKLETIYQDEIEDDIVQDLQLPADIPLSSAEHTVLDWILHHADLSPEDRIIKATQHILKTTVAKQDDSSDPWDGILNA
jgi:hypothetical protein